MDKAKFEFSVGGRLAPERARETCSVVHISLCTLNLISFVFFLILALGIFYYLQTTMTFQYKSSENIRKRKKYIKEELVNAIDDIKEGASIRKISIKYGIDRTTLRRYISCLQGQLCALNTR